MKSKNEEYLDSLLNSLKKDANSGIAKTTSDPEYTSDLNDVIGNSSGSNDLSEIGEMLGKVDSGQLLDEGMTKVLDSIVAPAVSDAPTYTVGDDVSDSYEKDDDERALDEEIARAEAAIEEAAEIQPDDTDALLEVAPEIPIDDLAQNDEVEQNSTDAAIDDMMRATPEEVLGVDFGASTTPSDEMLNIDEMLDAGTGEGEEVGLNDTLSLDGLEDLGGEAMPQEDLSVLLDSGDETSAITDEALSVDGLFDAEPSAEAVAEEVAAEPSVDAGFDDINIDEMMAAEPAAEDTVGDVSAEPSLGDINIDEMMAAEPTAEGAIGDVSAEPSIEGAVGDVSADPSLGDINIDEMMAAEPPTEGAVVEATAESAVDAGLGDINIDEMMAAEPAAEGAVGDINIDEMMATEPSFGDISIDEMMAAEVATEGAVADVSAEPSIEGAVGDVSAEPSLGDINIDEMMAAEAATEGEVSETTAEPTVDAGLGDINIDEMMAAEPATEGAVADVSAEPSIEGSVSDVSAEP
ncbi:hypothetical protein, partial [Butyrivibrio sp. AE3006]|uniref:hypothetical protein n=1 Tax=Butyrivibrio sp. AE3006 TaxID=1280673 RepID=UPI0018C94DA9